MDKLILEEILCREWISVSIEYDNFDELKSTVPRKPGLYTIKTNTPAEVFKSFDEREDNKHYNLSKKAQQAELLPSGFAIKQYDAAMYTVYSGHQKDLRQRFNEHFKGTNGTACLAIFKLKELLKYQWEFNYLNLTEINNYTDSKLLRTYLEQAYRIKIGWPILCSQ